MNFSGLFFGLITFLSIGLGFLWVIKLEYYVGAHVAKLIGIIGALIVLVSLFMPSPWFSMLVGIIGGTIIWGATELPDQEKRVFKGQFPANPKKNTKRIA